MVALFTESSTKEAAVLFPDNLIDLGPIIKVNPQSIIN